MPSYGKLKKGGAACFGGFVVLWFCGLVGGLGLDVLT